MSIIPYLESAPPITFLPVMLFKGGRNGWLWTADDFRFTWQDAAKAVPIVVGQTAYTLGDMSANDVLELIQATAANRPILRQKGLCFYLEFDGVNDFMAKASGLDIKTPFYMFMALTKYENSSDDIFTARLNSTNGARLDNINTSSRITAISQATGPGTSSEQSAELPNGTAIVVGLRITDGKTDILINDSGFFSDSSGDNTWNAGTLVANAGIGIATANLTASSTMRMDLYAAVIIQPEVALTTDEINSTVAFMREKSFTIEADDLPHNYVVQTEQVGGDAYGIVYVSGRCAYPGKMVQFSAISADDLSEHMAYVDLDVVAADGTWGAQVQVPVASEMLRSKFRLSEDHSVEIFCDNHWGVGDVVVTVGQSLKDLMFVNGQVADGEPVPPDATFDPRVQVYSDNNLAGALGWQVAPLGDGASAWFSTLAVARDRPQAAIQCAIGGTFMAAWEFETSTGATGGALEAVEKILLATTRGDGSRSGYRFATIDLGQSDATTDKYTFWLGALGNMADWLELYSLRTDFKFGIVPLGTMNVTPPTDVGVDSIRRAQMQFVLDDARACWLGSTAYLKEFRYDAYHLNYLGQIEQGKTYAWSILNQLGVAGYTYGTKGPKVATAARALASADVFVNFTHDAGSLIRERDGTTDGVNLTGFRILKSGTPLTVIATAITGSSQAKFTLSAVPADGVGETVDYQYGANPTVTKDLFDNASGYHDTKGIPLQASLGPITIVVT